MKVHDVTSRLITTSTTLAAVCTIVQHLDIFSSTWMNIKDIHHIWQLKLIYHLEHLAASAIASYNIWQNI